MPRKASKRIIDVENGLISRRVFFDEDIYREELEHVFAKCWLYLGHESQIAEAGDYVTNYMGEDPVFLCRDARGKVRAFLNSCRHRGMRLCRTDAGNARQFSCPFHGWTYSNEGKLVGVPFLQDAYHGELDREKWGLHEVPRVARYGGLYFGCWDAEAQSLEDYLGDMKWYLDILVERPIGGLEMIAGVQRYSCGANWKIASENFTGDTYHLPYSHGSIFRVNARRINPVSFQEAPKLFNISSANGHGLTSVGVGEERLESDLELAKELGAEVVDYVKESHARLKKRLSARHAKVYALAFGNIFPNLSYNNFSALRPFGFYLWHPKGPQQIEAWNWCAVDKAAPAVVKEMCRVDWSRVQATSGIAAQDDTENFEQVTEATRGVIGQTLDFNYQMGLGHEDEIRVAGYPGRFSPYYSEHCQTAFYGYWAELMEAGRAAKGRKTTKRPAAAALARAG